MARPIASSQRKSLRGAISQHIARKLAIAVLVSVLALDAVVLLPGYWRVQERFVSDVRRESAEVFRGAVDPTRYPSLSTLVAIGENLTTTTMISGGVFVTGIGEEKARFGDAPSLTWADARLNDEQTRVGEDFARIEVFLGPEVTRTSFGVILRLDSAARWAAAAARMMDIVILGVVAALALALVVYFIVTMQVARPVRAMRRAVDAALNAPETGATRLSRITQSDELGRLSRAVDQLLFLTAHTFEDELAAAQSVAEHAPHALLTFSADGHLQSANAAALRLLRLDTADPLLRRAPDKLFRFEGRTVTAHELLGSGSVLGPGELIGEDGPVPCLVGGDVVRRPDGSVLRMFLLFVDMRRLIEDMRDQVRRREEAESASRRVDAEMSRLRGRFDACLVLMEMDGADARPRTTPVTVDLARLAATWLERAAAQGTMEPDGLVTRDLPLVLGDPSETRRLIGIMLETAAQRSDAAKPRLEIVGRPFADGAVEVIVQEVSEAGDGQVRTVGGNGDTTLLIGAASVLARRQSGRITATQTADRGNALSCVLRIDEATMALENDTRPASAAKVA